MGQEKNC